MTTSATLTTAQLADEFGCDTRTLRKFLRDTLGDGKAVVGKGARYTIERKQVRSLKVQYGKWTTARDAEKQAKAEATPEEVTEDE